VSERALYLADAAAGEFPHRLAYPAEDLVQQIAVLLEIALTFGRDLIDLLAAGIHRADVALVLQKLKRGVHGAGGRGVAAGHLLLQRLDDLVPVAGLLLQQAEDHELDLARLEHLGTAA
jgi:hypothetical protein